MDECALRDGSGIGTVRSDQKVNARLVLGQTFLGKRADMKITEVLFALIVVGILSGVGIMAWKQDDNAVDTAVEEPAGAVDNEADSLTDDALTEDAGDALEADTLDEAVEDAIEAAEDALESADEAVGAEMDATADEALLDAAEEAMEDAVADETSATDVFEEAVDAVDEAADEVVDEAAEAMESLDETLDAPADATDALPDEESMMLENGVTDGDSLGEAVEETGGDIAEDANP